MPLNDRLAASCPGCAMPIVFDDVELAAPELPAFRDVMCAFCGTITLRSLLRRRARSQGGNAA